MVLLGIFFIAAIGSLLTHSAWVFVVVATVLYLTLFRVGESVLFRFILNLLIGFLVGRAAWYLLPFIIGVPSSVVLPFCYLLGAIVFLALNARSRSEGEVEAALRFARQAVSDDLLDEKTDLNSAPNDETSQINKNLQSFKEAVKRVRQLESVRFQMGFKHGWVYFRCKEEGILSVYRHLQSIGEMPEGFNFRRATEKPATTQSAQPESKTTADQTEDEEEDLEFEEDELDFDPYQLLAVTKTASAAEIKKAYIHMLSLHHPDKVQHLGDAIKKVAHEKTLQIRAAFDFLSKPK